VAAEPYRDSIFIEAPPAEVFEYFTRAEALVRWMGDRATLDPRPGGEFTLFFDDRCVQGRYVEVAPPSRLVISWGRQGSRDMPPFSSTLEVSFRPEGGGTRVDIVHHGLPHSESARHALGWRHYLGRLAILASGREPEPHQTPAALTEGVDD
jgi:uncharacterized protein YndB with AHSA1/START domain